MQWIEFEVSETAAVRDAQREFQRAQRVAHSGFHLFAWAEGPAPSGFERWRVESQFVGYLTASDVKFRPITDDESRSVAR